ncbi:hypothetical protein BK717_28530 [Bacillus thuringiensis serovar malayensis]|nr:hypothetical protein BK717_28530 [Bacillus thuringiensis serovar malayensis]
MKMFRLELFVEDLKKSADFYKDLLGFEITKHKSTAISLQYTNLSLLLTKESTWKTDHYFKKIPNSSKGKGVEFILQPKNFDLLYHHIKKSGYQLESELTLQSWGSNDFRIIDPDGYYWRIST